MTSQPRSLLLDTNVWIDRFMSSRAGFRPAHALVTLAFDKGIDLLYPASSSKDVYYIVASSFKNDIRAENEGHLSEEDALLANEMAWACLENMAETATAVGCDQTDIWLARKQRPIHGDYEDDLVIAAAMRSKAVLVTNDERFLRHCPVAAMDVHDATTWLRTLDPDGEQQAL